MDLEFLIKKEDHSLIKMICTKSKDIEKPKPFFFNLIQENTGWYDEEGESISSVILLESEESGINSQFLKRLTKNEGFLLNALEKSLTLFGTLPPSELKTLCGDDVEKVIDTHMWRNEALKALELLSDKQNTRVQIFRRSFNALIDKGRVGFGNDFIWLIKHSSHPNIKNYIKKVKH